MLVFKFTDVQRVRQAVKAFNRIDASGSDRERYRDIKGSGQRKYGRKYGRPQKVEDAFREMIKEGTVEVVRRKFKPPLIRFLAKPNETTVAALNSEATSSFESVNAMIEDL